MCTRLLAARNSANQEWFLPELATQEWFLPEISSIPSQKFGQPTPVLARATSFCKDGLHTIQWDHDTLIQLVEGLRRKPKTHGVMPGMPAPPECCLVCRFMWTLRRQLSFHPRKWGVYLCHYSTPEGYFCNEAGAATVTPTS